jgi:hypothetical protein
MDPSLNHMLQMPSMEVFNGLWTFTVVGVVLAFGVVTEWWAWAFLEISAGFISE